MTDKDPRPAWDAYLSAYGDISPAERTRLLRGSVTDDAGFTNPTGDRGQGNDALVAHIEGFQANLPGSYFRTNSVLSHHNELLAEWTLFKADGTAVTTAHTFARFNDDGRLTYMAGFFPPPGRPKPS